ncbi:MAG: DegT/DnrJ/EryC1/StrS family aminotransferase [Anaerorhabdus sp.]|uniref:DegT/DnrJ/EryC1/StrS family aminotransferase n=1 Tax=Anaerorhabdus sp. TaxID=1872524 RepID=UPI002FC76BF1
MDVLVNDLNKQFELFKNEYEQKAVEVLRSGWYVLGNEVKEFEKEFSTFTGTDYCVGVANGLDALWISLRVLGIKQGDEVIVQSNAYIATVLAITMNDATPVYVEPNNFHNIDDSLVEQQITDKTKAIIVTHLYGQATKMDKIKSLCKKYNIFLVEDCAQSHGAKYDEIMTGAWGDVGCFSFYPTKNLGCFGDGGAIVTNNSEIADKIRVFRNYGSKTRYYNEVCGTNSRLDEIQAGLLRVKLSHLNELQEERNKIAEKYLNGISNNLVSLPRIDEKCTTVWHQFVIESKHRDELMNYLEIKGIQTIIHYPVPPFMQECYNNGEYVKGTYPVAELKANEVLSIPIYNGLSIEAQEYVIRMINEFKI